MNGFAYALVFAVAMLLSLAAVHPARALSLRTGAVDRGGGRRAHEGDVPRLGGLGIYAVWAAITVVALMTVGAPQQNRPMAGVFLGSLLLLGVGWYDDVRSVGVRVKLTAQVAAALLVFSLGVRIDVLSNPLGTSLRPGLMELPLTVLWLVVVTNAYNLIDGIDGLAATAGITICVGMLVLYAGPDSFGRVAIVALAGALAGFLRHNFPPARIFMGDSGSQSVGFLLGAFSLLSFAKATTLAALFLPLVVFGHPLADMAYAILRRYHRGQPLGVADREHLHHKLLDRGYSRRAALGILVVLNIGLLALVLYLANRRLPGLVVILALLTIPSGIAIRIARHMLAGGSVREEALAFFMNRERRQVLHLGRAFRREAPRAASRAALDGLVRSFVGATGLSGVRIAVRAAGEAEETLFQGEAPVLGNRVSVCLTVVHRGDNFALLEVGVNRDEEGQKSLSDAAGALADGVRGFLEAGRTSED